MRRDRFSSCAILVAGLLATGCRDRASQPSEGPVAAQAPNTPTHVVATKLTDLSGSLDAIRASFNAHKHENRFLTPAREDAVMLE